MIFEQSGLGVEASFSQAIYVGITNLFFTIVAILLIDKVGRKPLLVIGVAGIAISMYVLAYGFNSATYSITNETIASLSSDVDAEQLQSLVNKEFSSDVEFKSSICETLNTSMGSQVVSELLSKSIKLNTYLILAALLAFVASFAVSIGPVMWVMFSELFPNRLRAIAVSFVGFINSFVSFSVQLVFPWELANIGTAPTFFIFGLIGSLGLVFIVAKVPETKGKSLEELQAYFLKTNK